MILTMHVGGLEALYGLARDLVIQREFLIRDSEGARTLARKRMWRKLHKVLASRGDVDKGGPRFWIYAEFADVA
ncbi:MAG: hypothetical protein ACYTBJ_01835 [Planctomycetota bacterium]|jgi:hypothetical protein